MVVEHSPIGGGRRRGRSTGSMRKILLSIYSNACGHIKPPPNLRSNKGASGIRVKNASDYNSIQLNKLLGSMLQFLNDVSIVPWERLLVGP